MDDPDIPFVPISPVPPGWVDRVNASFFERECRDALEWFFDFLDEGYQNGKFIKVRPVWLRSPLSRWLLELDCYNESLKFAVECDGSSTHRTCPKQIKRDLTKDRICRERGILLLRIRIPCVKGYKNWYEYRLIPYVIRDLLEANIDHFPTEIRPQLLDKIQTMAAHSGLRPSFAPEFQEVTEKPRKTTPRPPPLPKEECIDGMFF